jgi:hypothetical protein
LCGGAEWLLLGKKGRNVESIITSSCNRFVVCEPSGALRRESCCCCIVVEFSGRLIHAFGKLSTFGRCFYWLCGEWPRLLLFSRLYGDSRWRISAHKSDQIDVQSTNLWVVVRQLWPSLSIACADGLIRSTKAEIIELCSNVRRKMSNMTETYATDSDLFICAAAAAAFESHIIICRCIKASVA